MSSAAVKSVAGPAAASGWWTVPRRSFAGGAAPPRIGDHTFRPLFDNETFTYTFLLADNASGECVLIDPVYEHAERDSQIINELGLKLIYGINTHMHADHVTGTGMLKKHFPDCKSVIAKTAPAKADVFINDGDFIKFGKFQLECRATPGHTAGCMTYVWHEKAMAFTGDALLIRKCGRTDFPGGQPEVLYDGIHKKIFSLPDNFVLYPGHDYTGQLMTTVAEEKQFNTRLHLKKPEFIDVMVNLGKQLGLPKKFHVSIESNLVDGEELRYPKTAS
jgi:sulfur dioxygenase